MKCECGALVEWCWTGKS